MWHTFEQGRSLGTRGPEKGVIVSDEEYHQAARMTLEQGSLGAPWAITCEIYKLFIHRAFFADETEAKQKYSAMKRDLEDILKESPSSPCHEKLRLFADSY